MLPLTPQRLGTVYDMLRSFPPFSGWGLPPGSEVKFHVAKTKKHQAAWWIEGNIHHIEVSEKKHGHLETAVETMAHEMIHVRQRIAKTETSGVEHNAEFQRLALRVCKVFGFDYGQFNG